MRYLPGTMGSPRVNAHREPPSFRREEPGEHRVQKSTSVAPPPS